MKNLTYLILAGFCLMLYACGDNTSNVELTNTKASLPASFNFSAAGLKVITTFINKKQGTMSTLYGNPLALKTAISGTNTVAGEVLALVTWKQQADVHWFGANIPGNLQSVEMIKTNSNGALAPIDYKRYEGKTLTLNADTMHQAERIRFIFNQKPSVMP